MRRRFTASAAGAGALAWALAVVLSAGCGTRPAGAGPGGDDSGETKEAAAAAKDDDKSAREPAPNADGLVPLTLELPKPAFVGTPKQIPPGTTVEKPTGKPRPPYMVAPGLTNVALGKPISASDEEPIIGEIDLITDGDKEARDGSYVELGPGKQHVQVDLGAVYDIRVILFWNYHGDPRVYHDVVVRGADDPDFIMGVKTLFNNDHDNSSGLGVGSDCEYFELYEGRLVPTKDLETRYIRWYVNGSTADEMNRFTEIEVYGKPAE